MAQSHKLSEIQHKLKSIEQSQIENADEIIASTEAASEMLAKIQTDISYGFDRISEGLQGIASAFEWGMAEVVHHLELQRQQLKRIIEILEAPLDTKAKELRKRAEYAYINGWIDEALVDFLEAEKKNYQDFTIHQSLGNICFFHKKDYQKALEYYENAAKYARPQSTYHASLAYLSIGYLMFTSGDTEGAYEATKMAVETSPDLCEAWYQHSRYSALLGRAEEGVRYLKRAIWGNRNYALKPSSDKAFDGIRSHLHRLNEELREEARKEAEVGLRKFKGSLVVIQKTYKAQFPREKLSDLRERLQRVENLYGRNSYFDYLDVIVLALEAYKDSLSEKLKIMEKTRYGNQEKLQKVKEKAGRAAGCATGLLILLVLVNITSNVFGPTDKGTLFFWFVVLPSSGLVYYVVSRSIRKLKASRQEKILKKQSSELEKLREEINRLE